MGNIYEDVIYDLDILNELSRKLVSKMPPAGSRVQDELYLQTVSIQILIISHLEYFLKNLKIVEEKEQYKILDIIKTSSLDQLEKDHLVYLFFVRHTLVHNGGHCDSKFLKDINSNIKKLKLKGFKEDLLSSADTDLLTMYIELTKKLVKELWTKKNK